MQFIPGFSLPAKEDAQEKAKKEAQETMFTNYSIPPCVRGKKIAQVWQEAKAKAKKEAQEAKAKAQKKAKESKEKTNKDAKEALVKKSLINKKFPRKVISWSLYINMDNLVRLPEYFCGLQYNVKAAEKWFPDWELRLYIDKSVEDNTMLKNAVDKIATSSKTHPIQVIKCRDGMNPMVERYRPLVDSIIDVCISRDVDSVLSKSDMEKVESWLMNDNSDILRYRWIGQGCRCSMGGGIGIKCKALKGVKPLSQPVLGRYQDEHLLRDGLLCRIPKDRHTVYTARKLDNGVWQLFDEDTLLPEQNQILWNTPKQAELNWPKSGLNAILRFCKKFKPSNSDIYVNAHLDKHRLKIIDQNKWVSRWHALETHKTARKVALEKKNVSDHKLQRNHELLYRPKGDFLKNFQKDITSNMRAILVNWLVEVAEDYNLKQVTLFTSINYVDRCLALFQVTRHRLQLLGCACMLLASKYEEIDAPDVDEFVYISDNTYSSKQVVRMESKVLDYFKDPLSEHLKFQLTVCTIMTFLPRYLSALRKIRGIHKNEEEKKRCEHLANYFAELALQDFEMVHYRRSIIAASCVSLARRTLKQDVIWHKTLQNITGYNLNDIETCEMRLLALHQKNCGEKLQAIYRKYSSQKNMKVAKLDPIGRIDGSLEKKNREAAEPSEREEP